MKAFHKKQGPADYVVVELFAGMQNEMVIGEAERFAKQLSDAIKAAKQSAKPPLKAFWNT